VGEGPEYTESPHGDVKDTRYLRRCEKELADTLSQSQADLHSQERGKDVNSKDLDN